MTGDIDWPLRFGAEIRRWNLLQGLLAAGPTDAIVLGQGEEPAERPAFTGCDRLVLLPRWLHAWSERQQRWYGSTLGRAALTLGDRRPYDQQYANPRELRSIVRRDIRPADYDLVWFMTAKTIPVMDSPRGPATILDGDDYSYLRELGLLRHSPWYGAKVWNYLDALKLWRQERRYPQRYDFVVRCSADDRARHAAANVVVIPNGITVPAHCGRKPAARLLFVGVLAYPPNAHGVAWFLRHVWPAIRARVPEAGLDIVGKDPPPPVRDAHGKDGVTVHGFVDDLTPLYERASASIVPLFAGGGTRLKILEALARSVPVVSTTLGAFGIEADARHGLERVDSPTAFADRCVDVLTDDSGAMQWRAAAGRDLMAQRYDWRRIQGAVTDLVRRAVAMRSTPKEAVR